MVLIRSSLAPLSPLRDSFILNNSKAINTSTSQPTHDSTLDLTPTPLLTHGLIVTSSHRRRTSHDLICLSRRLRLSRPHLRLSRPHLPLSPPTLTTPEPPRAHLLAAAFLTCIGPHWNHTRDQISFIKFPATQRSKLGAKPVFSSDEPFALTASQVRRTRLWVPGRTRRMSAI